MSKYYITALIPARSGSKGIKDKNIKTYHGKPLLSYSIKQGLESHFIDEVVVTTDSKQYRDISIEHGADSVVMRPKEISGDLSVDYEFFLHYVNLLSEKNSKIPDFIVLLRPTYPLRNVDDIDKAISMFIDNYDKVDSMRSVVPCSQTPYKMWHLKESGMLEAVCSIKGQNEAFNLPRQSLPAVYWQNACIDIVKTSTIVNMRSVTGKRVFPYIMKPSEVYDIDTIDDFYKSTNKHRNC